MKIRWIALFTVLSFALIGCGGGEETTESEPMTQQPAQQTATAQEEAQAVPQAEPASEYESEPEQEEMASSSEEMTSEESSEEEGSEESGININTASSSQLQELTGVGPSTAESIIAYREENGDFSSIDELAEVSGIGSATIEKIRPDAKVSGETVMASEDDTEESSSSESSEDAAEPAGDAVNINTASKSELESLNGIGPATADKIISYREENGEFSSPADIKNVSGIGDATFEKNKSRLVTE